ncbi:MAG: S1C family serine protease [Alphaproteobacteria bacterium]
MSDAKPEIRPSFQPRPEDWTFDLDRALSAVVSLRSRVPDDAFTAAVLGTQREGQGVMIREDGLVLTIGYLVTEASSIWLTANNGQAVSAHLVGYDQASGLGLVQALGRLDIPALEIGSVDALRVGDKALVAAQGGRKHASRVQVVAKREFAGSWEYVLDEAIFTSPPHPTWSGAALVDRDGRLAGIGSLYMRQVMPGNEEVDGNMIVPIDLLQPILDDLLMYGRVQRPPRPWLGMTVAETENCLVVAGTYDGGPARRAGVETGDIVLGLDGSPVRDLAGFFRRVWALGTAGVDVPLHLVRDGARVDVSVRSADRHSFLKAPRLH